MEPRALRDPRDSGGVSAAEPARVHHHSDHGATRLETKKTLKRVRKISHAHIFEASISRSAAQNRLIDDLMDLLGDKLQPVMACWLHGGIEKTFTLNDVREAERALLALPVEGDKEKTE